MKIRLGAAAVLTTAGIVAASGIPALGGTAAAPAAIVAGTGSFGAVHAVPLPPGPPGQADFGPSLSCVPHGRCVAVISDVSPFNDANQVYLVSDNGGAWSAPAAVPGLEASTGNTATVDGSACPATGDCLVAGNYYSGPNRLGPQHGFVQEEVNGTWGKPQVIPGLAALASAQLLIITSVACPAPGHCTVAGQYASGTSTRNGFVVDEVAYKWGDAQPVPGLAKLNIGGSAGVGSVVCASARNCTLEGTYTARVPSAGVPDDLRVFVDSEVNGTWQQASAPAIPNAATSFAQPGSNLACAAAGDCLLAVQYTVTATNAGSQYLLRQSGGKWSVTADNVMRINAIACPAVNGCVAGGSNGSGVAATMRQVNGTWTAPTVLPGATALSFLGQKASASKVTGLACPAVADCTAVGDWNTDLAVPEPDIFGFVAAQASGTWSKVALPAGSAALNANRPWSFTEIACAAIATCATLGEDGGNYNEGIFVVPEIPLRASATTIGRSLATVTFGHEQTEKVAVHVTGPVTPSAKVTVKSGSTVICTITLSSSGVGTCSLTARQLAVGPYHLVASYPGSYGLASSSSGSVPLTVVK